MDILVVGAAGMLGRKLASSLVTQHETSGRTISRLTLADIVEPEPAGSVRARTDRCVRSLVAGSCGEVGGVAT